jgi:hypothetical protein
MKKDGEWIVMPDYYMKNWSWRLKASPYSQNAFSLYSRENTGASSSSSYNNPASQSLAPVFSREYNENAF